MPPTPYPPPRHFLTDLGLEIDVRGDDSASVWLPVSDHVTGPGADVATGVLATLVDVAGGLLASRAAAPDWIATADLDLHVASTRGAAEVEAHGRIARAGRTTVVVEVALVPGGTATMTFAVLPRRHDNPVIDDDERAPGRRPLAGPPGGLTEPFARALGIDTVDAAAGRLRAPVTPYCRNTLGAVQGGVVATLAEASAAAAVGARIGRAARTVDLHLAFLALGRTGPVVTTAEVLGCNERAGTARVEVADDDGRGRLMAVAVAEAVAP